MLVPLESSLKKENLKLKKMIFRMVERMRLQLMDTSNEANVSQDPVDMLKALVQKKDRLWKENIKLKKRVMQLLSTNQQLLMETKKDQDDLASQREMMSAMEETIHKQKEELEQQAECKVQNAVEEQLKEVEILKTAFHTAKVMYNNMVENSPPFGPVYDCMETESLMCELAIVEELSCNLQESVKESIALREELEKQLIQSSTSSGIGSEEGDVVNNDECESNTLKTEIKDTPTGSNQLESEVVESSCVNESVCSTGDTDVPVKLTKDSSMTNISTPEDDLASQREMMSAMEETIPKQKEELEQQAEGKVQNAVEEQLEEVGILQTAFHTAKAMYKNMTENSPASDCKKRESLMCEVAMLEGLSSFLRESNKKSVAPREELGKQLIQSSTSNGIGSEEGDVANNESNTLKTEIKDTPTGSNQLESELVESSCVNESVCSTSDTDVPVKLTKDSSTKTISTSEDDLASQREMKSAMEETINKQSEELEQQAECKVQNAAEEQLKEVGILKPAFHTAKAMYKNMTENSPASDCKKRESLMCEVAMLEGLSSFLRESNKKSVAPKEELGKQLIQSSTSNGIGSGEGDVANINKCESNTLKTEIKDTPTGSNQLESELVVASCVNESVCSTGDTDVPVTLTKDSTKTTISTSEDDLASQREMMCAMEETIPKQKEELEQQAECKVQNAAEEQLKEVGILKPAFHTAKAMYKNMTENSPASDCKKRESLMCEVAMLEGLSRLLRESNKKRVAPKEKLGKQLIQSSTSSGIGSEEGDVANINKCESNTLKTEIKDTPTGSNQLESELVKASCVNESVCSTGDTDVPVTLTKDSTKTTISTSEDVCDDGQSIPGREDSELEMELDEAKIRSRTLRIRQPANQDSSPKDGDTVAAEMDSVPILKQRITELEVELNEAKIRSRTLRIRQPANQDSSPKDAYYSVAAVFKEQLDQAKLLLHEKDQEIQNLKEKVECRVLLEKLGHQITTSKEDYDKLKEELQTLQEEVNTANGELIGGKSNLQSENDDQTKANEVCSLESQADTAEPKSPFPRETSPAVDSDLLAEMDDMKKEKADIEAELENLKAELRDSKTRSEGLRFLYKQVHETTAEESALLNTKMDDVKKEKADIEAELENVKAELRDSKTQYEGLRFLYKQVHETTAEESALLNTKMDDMKKEKADIVAELENVKAELRDSKALYKQSIVTTEERDYPNVNSKLLVNMATEVERLLKELRMSQEESLNLQDDIDTANEVSEGLIEQAEYLRSQLEESKKKLERTEATVRCLSQKNKVYRNKMKSAGIIPPGSPRVGRSSEHLHFGEFDLKHPSPFSTARSSKDLGLHTRSPSLTSSNSSLDSLPDVKYVTPMGDSYTEGAPTVSYQKMQELNAKNENLKKQLARAVSMKDSIDKEKKVLEEENKRLRSAFTGQQSQHGLFGDAAQAHENTEASVVIAKYLEEIQVLQNFLEETMDTTGSLCEQLQANMAASSEGDDEVKAFSSDIESTSSNKSGIASVCVTGRVNDYSILREQIQEMHVVIDGVETMIRDQRRLALKGSQEPAVLRDVAYSVRSLHKFLDDMDTRLSFFRMDGMSDCSTGCQDETSDYQQWEVRTNF